MQLVFSTITMCFFLSYPLSGSQADVRPSFEPYCSKLQICVPVCRCREARGCTLIPMTDATRDEILLYHNQIRDVQTKSHPEPSGLSLLKYDMELEEISTCWAAECTNDYTECFKTTSFSEISQSVGQIIIEEDETPEADLWMQLLHTWLPVLDELPLEEIHTSPHGSDLTEHNIAQILSDKILFVGCAWSISENWLTFVCSYGPRGPLHGELIYRTGVSCSTCPKGYVCHDVEPFERLCKSTETARVGINRKTKRKKNLVKTRVNNERKSKVRNGKSRSYRAGDKEPEAKPRKKRSSLPLVVGISTFFVLLLFFLLVGGYAYVISRMPR